MGIPIYGYAIRELAKTSDEISESPLFCGVSGLCLACLNLDDDRNERPGDQFLHDFWILRSKACVRQLAACPRLPGNVRWLALQSEDHKIEGASADRHPPLGFLLCPSHPNDLEGQSASQTWNVN